MNYSESIVVAREFSDAPGARHTADGVNSAEEFLERLLRPKFIAAQKEGGKLFVDLDGTWGYASSFVSGSFGALAREFGAATVNQHLAFKSDEDPLLLEKIAREISTEGDRA
jgi:hypothetical protein